MFDGDTPRAIRCGDTAARVSLRGAELVSLQQAGRELIWQGDPRSWDAHSPLLFPFVGRLNGGCFTVDGRRYAADIHGFARNLLWSVLAETDCAVTLSLRSSEVTMALYPFPFSLESRFTAEEDGLRVERTVTNIGKQTMPYFIGEHPGFAVPLLADGEFDGCRIVFEQPEDARQYFHDGRVLTGEAPYGKGVDTIPVTRALFRQTPVLLLAGLRSRYVTLYAGGRERVRLSIGAFDYLAIWTHPVPSAFVCVEPWRGIPSFAGDVHELCDKRGVRLLAPGRGESYRYHIHTPDWEGLE